MKTTKTTGHFKKRLQLFFFASLLTVTGSARAEAPRIVLTTANDLISGSSRGDDLYTAALGLEVESATVRWDFGERMFTDRDRNRRFDETYLELARRVPLAGPWKLEVGGGLVHLGHGLLGQRVQNEVHRVVGADRVELPYVSHERWIPSARLRIDRPFYSGPHGALAVSAELSTAPAFRSSQKIALLGERTLSNGLALRASIGGRADQTATDLLGDAIASHGATAEIGVAWRGISLRWSRNDFGTGSGYLSAGVDLGGEAVKALRRRAR